MGIRRYNGRMRHRARPAVLFAIGVGGLLAISTAWSYRTQRLAALGDNRNFVVMAPYPRGWLPQRTGPMTVSMYVHPTSGVTMRCARNESVAATRTEPGMDGQALATQFINLTRERLKGWSAFELESIVGPRWIAPVTDRQAPDRRVVTAYLVQGNSTYVFTLCGIGGSKQKVEEHIAQFRDWVAHVELAEVVR
ncbi:MAG: hypothetical protein HONBIEJF_01861 [Fimbriimonadaceae bacterium]|nr:hypothetical protein [Fimbriimonadaceae bacterium]